MRKTISTIVGLILFSSGLFSQSAPFNVILEPINISELGGLQAYAFGQHEGKWLIVGGRLDGLHQRQPFAAFDEAGNNNHLIVVDPVAQEKWTAPLSSLPTGMQEQLSSTNMNFYQDGDYLYFTGGYGYSNSLDDHTTYPMLTAIKISKVIDAIISGSDFTPFFRQISDPIFQSTGGRLKKINDRFYLCGGQKFMGRYNPMGPDHGPGFIQEYTDAVRIFEINDDGINISINHLPSYFDTDELHRRDYNAESQIMPNGEQGITMFSGVFQKTVNLPFLNSVDISESGYTVNNDFQQYYNHYHCPALPLFSEETKKMHTVFFGGIAQFFEHEGMLVQDNDVPFVKTIARVTRDQNGIMTEYKLPIEMPELLGAGAEFILNKDIPHYENEVFKLDEITLDTTMVGYIYGGISSMASNIFFTNTGEESEASSQIFRVLLIKNTDTGIHRINPICHSTLKLNVFPNPNDGDFRIEYILKKSTELRISLSDMSGKIIFEDLIPKGVSGKQSFRKQIEPLTYASTYFLSVETSTEKETRKIYIAP